MDCSTSLDRAMRSLIENTLRDCGGNKSEAARRLGISHRTISRKIKQWECIDRLAKKFANVDKVSNGGELSTM